MVNVVHDSINYENRISARVIDNSLHIFTESFNYFVPELHLYHGTPIIVPSEAESVKKIYKLFLEGKTFREIARSLEKERVKSPMGKDTWRTTTYPSIGR